MKKSETTNTQPQIELKNTTAIQTENGSDIWKQGVVLRRVSRFITNSAEDAILPIPVFYDSSTGKILKESLPLDLREEYDTI
jgi:hypothetical protein